MLVVPQINQNSKTNGKILKKLKIKNLYLMKKKKK